jgi:hypothetical protein
MEEFREKGITEGSKEAIEYAWKALYDFYKDRHFHDMAKAVSDFFNNLL